MCLLGPAVPAASHALLGAVPAVPAKTCCAAEDTALPPGSWSCSLPRQVLCQGHPHRQGRPPAASQVLLYLKAFHTSSLFRQRSARGPPTCFMLCLARPAVPAGTCCICSFPRPPCCRTRCAAKDSSLHQSCGPAASHAKFSAKVFPTARVVLLQPSPVCSGCTCQDLRCRLYCCAQLQSCTIAEHLTYFLVARRPAQNYN